LAVANMADSTYGHYRLPNADGSATLTVQCTPAYVFHYGVRWATGQSISVDESFAKGFLTAMLGDFNNIF